MISQELLDRVMAKVPDYQTFMTVDEMDESSRKLAETYPDVVELFEAGRSRGGHPIYCLKIGNGSENAICYGTPHPNEPIGSMLLEAFSQIQEDTILVCHGGVIAAIMEHLFPEENKTRYDWQPKNGHGYRITGRSHEMI